MPEPILVSIIIPTFNRARLIGQTLDSVLSQSYSFWECLVVDDGSTDGTEGVVIDYVSKDSRFQYHQRPITRPKGANACRNYGFEMSRGACVNWFDSDDIMLPNKLEKKLNLLLDSGADFVVSKGALHEKLPELEPIPWPLHLEGNILFNHICGRIAFVTNGPLFRRDFLLKSDVLFDERLQVRQEWEFFNRLLMTKPHVEVLLEPLYLFRTLGSGVRRSDSILKAKSKILAEQFTFKNLRGKSFFSRDEDLFYRKQTINRCFGFYKPLSLSYKMKLFFVFAKTVIVPLNYEVIKSYFAKFFNPKDGK
ncbi:MAG: glycosyltransferase family 2 protein [Ignavibacteriae bacterium]|nr:glycosyltransferase family 2 protein [Ignavibacteriota bacterium]